MRISDWSSDVCSSDLVIIGGRIADALRARNPAGRILMILFGVIAPIVPIWIGYTTANGTLFYVMNFLAGMFGAAALGAAAATTQDLEIGRASCRERVCRYVEIAVVDVSLKKKKNKN